MDLIGYLRYLKESGAEFVPLNDPNITVYLNEYAEAPCPFCGGFALTETVEDGVCFVCQRCYARSPKGANSYYAKKLWNISTKISDDLTVTQKKVLVFLQEAGDGYPVPVKELAKKVDVSYSTMVYCLRSLQDKGFVKKSKSGWVALPLPYDMFANSNSFASLAGKTDNDGQKFK